MRRIPILIGLVVVLLIAGLSSIFIVDERKQALVLQFGQVKQIRTEPGLGVKLPFIQDVVYYEGRILPLDTQPLEVTPLDERRLVVDAFARWRIVNPVEFRQAVQTEAAGAARLESILNASLREVLGSVPSEDVLSPERTVLMGRIRDEARRQARNLGVEIVDVRIRRADLPEQNLNATFERMNAEREREAADERARGKERAQEIRATADRQAVELVSDAQRQGAIIRGQADAERNRVYASAFGRDPEFFAFYRSLEAYEKALTGGNSTMVMSPDSQFFEYLKSDKPLAGPGGMLPAAPVAALPAPSPEPSPAGSDGAASAGGGLPAPDTASDAAAAPAAGEAVGEPAAVAPEATVPDGRTEAPAEPAVGTAAGSVGTAAGSATAQASAAETAPVSAAETATAPADTGAAADAAPADADGAAAAPVPVR